MRQTLFRKNPINFGTILCVFLKATYNTFTDFPSFGTNLMCVFIHKSPRTSSLELAQHSLKLNPKSNFSSSRQCMLTQSENDHLVIKLNKENLWKNKGGLSLSFKLKFNFLDLERESITHHHPILQMNRLCFEHM